MRNQALTLCVIGVAAGVAVLGLSGQEQSQALYGMTPDVDLFHNFIATHGKSYKNQEEFQLRFAQFKRNLALIRTHAAMNADATFTLGVNKFSDYTVEEYRNLLGYKKSHKLASNKPLFKADPARDVPASIDWRQKGAVTAVKDQGQCGSCWAFSTTGALESRDFIATGKLNDYSEQQLVDCDKGDDNDGCNGGDMYTAMVYTSSNPLESEESYPYAGVDQTCAYDKTKGISSNTGATNVTPNSKADLKAAIA